MLDPGGKALSFLSPQVEGRAKGQRVLVRNHKKWKVSIRWHGSVLGTPFTSSILLFWIFGFVDAFLDLANLFRDGDFFWTHLCALP
jgi:hypothetical protein